MKLNAFRSRKVAKLPVAWREAEYAAIWVNVTDTCEDRISENIFDIEDEHTEVDIIVRRMMRGAN